MNTDEDYFVIKLSDGAIDPTVAMSEMIRVREKHSGLVLLAVEVEPPQVSSYGVFDVSATNDDRVKKVTGMVEKPAAENALSELVASAATLWTDRFSKPFAALSQAREGSCSLLKPSICSSPKATPSTSWCMMASATTSAFPPASNSASATRSTDRHCSMTWKRLRKTTGWSETRRRKGSVGRGLNLAHEVARKGLH